MINDNSKILCLVVFTLTASGCGGGGADGTTDDSQIVNPLIVVDESLLTDDNTQPEVTVGTQTSDGFATPVVTVNSVQMDEYIENPLLTRVPSELMDGSPGGVTRSYITNPLIN